MFFISLKRDSDIRIIFYFFVLILNIYKYEMQFLAPNIVIQVPLFARLLSPLPSYALSGQALAPPSYPTRIARNPRYRCPCYHCLHCCFLRYY